MCMLFRISVVIQGNNVPSRAEVQWSQIISAIAIIFNFPPESEANTLFLKTPHSINLASYPELKRPGPWRRAYYCHFPKPRLFLTEF